MMCLVKLASTKSVYYYFCLVGLGYIWFDDNSNHFPSICNLVLNAFQVRWFKVEEIVIAG